MRVVMSRFHLKLLQSIALVIGGILLITFALQRDIQCYGDQRLEEPSMRISIYSERASKKNHHKNTVKREPHKNHMIESAEGPWQRSTHLKKHLREACRTLQPQQEITIDLLNRILVDEDREILYCYVPK
ncbi:unnamed protein product, partial [Meganyctiphanes norvegica]